MENQHNENVSEILGYHLCHKRFWKDKREKKRAKKYKTRAF